MEYQTDLLSPPGGSVAIQPGLVAGVELIGDGMKWVAAQNLGVLQSVVPDDLEVDLVEREANGVAFSGVEQVVTYDRHAKKGVHFLGEQGNAEELCVKKWPKHDRMVLVTLT